LPFLYFYIALWLYTYSLFYYNHKCEARTSQP
jgi:hypothetical protein